MDATSLMDGIRLCFADHNHLLQAEHDARPSSADALTQPQGKADDKRPLRREAAASVTTTTTASSTLDPCVALLEARRLHGSFEERWLTALRRYFFSHVAVVSADVRVNSDDDAPNGLLAACVTCLQRMFLLDAAGEEKAAAEFTTAAKGCRDPLPRGVYVPMSIYLAATCPVIAVKSLAASPSSAVPPPSFVDWLDDYCSIAVAKPLIDVVAARVASLSGGDNRRRGNGNVTVDDDDDDGGGGSEEGTTGTTAVAAVLSTAVRLLDLIQAVCGGPPFAHTVSPDATLSEKSDDAPPPPSAAALIHGVARSAVHKALGQSWQQFWMTVATGAMVVAMESTLPSSAAAHRSGTTTTATSTAVNLIWALIQIASRRERKGGARQVVTPAVVADDRLHDEDIEAALRWVMRRLLLSPAATLSRPKWSEPGVMPSSSLLMTVLEFEQRRLKAAMEHGLNLARLRDRAARMSEIASSGNTPTAAHSPTGSRNAMGNSTLAVLAGPSSRLAWLAVATMLSRLSAVAIFLFATASSSSRRPPLPSCVDVTTTTTTSSPVAEGEGDDALLQAWTLETFWGVAMDSCLVAILTAFTNEFLKDVDLGDSEVDAARQQNGVLEGGEVEVMGGANADDEVSVSMSGRDHPNGGDLGCGDRPVATSQPSLRGGAALLSMVTSVASRAVKKAAPLQSLIRASLRQGRDAVATSAGLRKSTSTSRIGAACSGVDRRSRDMAIFSLLWVVGRVIVALTPSAWQHEREGAVSAATTKSIDAAVAGHALLQGGWDDTTEAGSSVLRDLAQLRACLEAALRSLSKGTR